MRRIDEIIIHATATRPRWMHGQPTAKKVAEIRRWHVQERGWSDIGYHFLIDRDGTVAKGRPVNIPGAHVRGHNATTIGIALIGGHGATATDAFEDHFTQEQNSALRGLIDELQRLYGPGLKISGHNEYANKACPGFQVKRWLKRKPPARKSPVQSTTLQATGAGAAATIGGVVQAVGALDGRAQIAVIVLGAIVLAALAWIARERLRRWARGDR